MSQAMVERIEIKDGHSVVVENDSVKEISALGVDAWSMVFTSKAEVERFISLLNTALKYWHYEDKPKNE